MKYTTLKIISEILELDYADFALKYHDSLTGTGERTCDLAIHTLNIDKETELQICFVDFSIDRITEIDKASMLTIDEWNYEQIKNYKNENNL